MGVVQVWAMVVASIIGLGGAGWVARFAVVRLWIRDFLARVDVEIRHVVLEVEQTYVDAVMEAKDPKSPGGVELTDDEKKEALNLAVDRAFELVGFAALERAMRILGLPHTFTFIRRWIETRVEAHVKLLSMAQRVSS